MVDGKWIISEPAFEADVICPKYKIWPWNGHRRFAYDLVRLVRPKRFVELGTYWGTSFFAFCQAVKDFNLETECVAIDTWKGDDHTGPYETEALDTFNRVNKEIFEKINVRPLKMTFKEALSFIEEDSIDILHIDGCHDYDPVKEDYLTWLPKLEKEGIILFHDVADSVEYESVRFWKEISENVPNMRFQHSWGLGVLFPKGDYYFKQMRSDNFEDKMKIYEYRSDLDYALVRIDILKGIVESKNKTIAEKTEAMSFLEKKIQDLQRSIDECQNTLRRFQSSPLFRLFQNFRKAFKTC